jgi:hypothetical protein
LAASVTDIKRGRAPQRDAVHALAVELVALSYNYELLTGWA